MGGNTGSHIAYFWQCMVECNAKSAGNALENRNFEGWTNKNNFDITFALTCMPENGVECGMGHYTT